MQLNNANKFPEFKYIISGQLKMKEISHTGKNYSFLSHLKYETLSKMIKNKINARSKRDA